MAGHTREDEEDGTAGVPRVRLGVGREDGETVLVVDEGTDGGGEGETGGG